jgi:hypothetical protein
MNDLVEFVDWLLKNVDDGNNNLRRALIFKWQKETGRIYTGKGKEDERYI